MRIHVQKAEYCKCDTSLAVHGTASSALMIRSGFKRECCCLQRGIASSHDLRFLGCFVAGVPLEKALGFLPTKSLANMPLAGAAFVPPTSVQGIAKAAVAAATDPAVPGGIMDVWQLQQYDKQ